MDLFMEINGRAYTIIKECRVSNNRAGSITYQIHIGQFLNEPKA